MIRFVLSKTEEEVVVRPGWEEVEGAADRALFQVSFW